MFHVQFNILCMNNYLCKFELCVTFVVFVDKCIIIIYRNVSINL